MSDDLLRRDAAHVWHPYTQHEIEAPPLPVVGAKDARLRLADGREIVDAISSWWTCLHGHGHPRLREAMATQAAELDHVLFAGATHEPAVALAEALLAVAPPGLGRVFYSDDGSTAVEVALKMIRQRWVHEGEPERLVFVALEGGYHGDTFGAMAVGDPDPFFESFAPLLFTCERVPADAAALESTLDRLGARCAGVILEPLVQGAAGMRMHPPAFVRAVDALCKGRGLPWIADEVMTGFGRTGTLFACEQAGVTPDALCTAKGLTGGTFPLSATLAKEEIFASFLSDDRGRAFFHGHSFTANPVGCAVGLASLDVVRESDVPGRLDAIGRRIELRLRDQLGDTPRAVDLRRTGGIVAYDRAPEASDASGGYLAGEALRLRAEALEQGILLRPLGNVVYAMPPACTTPDECDRIAAAMAHLARV